MALIAKRYFIFAVKIRSIQCASSNALRDRDSDVTLIITESSPGLLRPCADRVLVIERGEVQQGPIQSGRTAT